MPGDEADGILQDGIYQAYASCITDADGKSRILTEEVHHDRYLGRDVVSLDRIHVDISCGAS